MLTQTVNLLTSLYSQEKNFSSHSQEKKEKILPVWGVTYQVIFFSPDLPSSSLLENVFSFPSLKPCSQLLTHKKIGDMEGGNVHLK